MINEISEQLGKLFENPFDQNSSLLRKTVYVAFHTVTLGIPLGIHTLIDYSFPKVDEVHSNLKEIALKGMLSKLDKPDLVNKEAMDFANAKLNEHKDVKLSKFDKKINSENKDLLKLLTIYSDIYLKKFEALIQKHSDNPWQNEEVIKAADDCIKLAYAIGMMTLEDLPAFMSKRPDSERRFDFSLTRQDSYQYRTFYYLPVLYHLVRAGAIWRKPPGSERMRLYFPDKKVTKEEAAPFYQKDTLQNNWNELYNSYCKRVRMIVPEEDLQDNSRYGDSRHAAWTKVDAKFEDFRDRPDTMPT